VADGGPDVGHGHQARSSAIAAGLCARGAAVRCLAYGAREPTRVDAIDWEPYSEPEADTLLLDSYVMPAAERAGIAERAKLVVLHDQGEPTAGTALTIAVTGEPGPDRLTGLAYAPLRPPYWGLPAREPRATVERILVTTGGGPLQDAGIELAARIRASHDAAVALVRGPYATFAAPDGVELIDAPPSLLEHMLAADVVVTAAGQTSLEAVATGAATIAVPMVDNQRRNAAALQAAQAALVVEPGQEAAALHRLDRPGLAERGQRAVDGYGALRIAYRIAALAAQPRRT
jgi:spore coat polysaccharide biosynthesis predicted glycosyltransferase SpsG